MDETCAPTFSPTLAAASQRGARTVNEAAKEAVKEVLPLPPGTTREQLLARFHVRGCERWAFRLARCAPERPSRRDAGS
jgi:hypothetical protein